MFKIEANGEHYIVIPTAEYLEERFNRFDLPYDTNWEIYRLYNYKPREFFQYLISVFEAEIYVKERWPYFEISFNKEINALRFKQELEERAEKYSTQQEN